jgi:anti-anti-sigma factor
MTDSLLWRHTVSHHHGQAVVVLAGELDISATDALRDLLDEISQHEDVTVDLAAVTFLDSTIISVRVRAYLTAQDAERRFAVSEPSPATRRILTVAGVLELLTPGA